MTPGAGLSAGGERADLRARLVSQGRERLRGDAGAGRREPKGEEGVRWAARLGCWRGSGSGRREVGREERLGRPERGKRRRSWVGPGCWVGKGEWASAGCWVEAVGVFGLFFYFFSSSISNSNQLFEFKQNFEFHNLMHTSKINAPA